MCRSQVFTSFTVLVWVFVQICIYCRTNNRQTYWLSWTTQKNRRTGQKPHFLDLCPHRTVNCEGRLVSSYFLRFHNFGLLWCGNQIKSSKVFGRFISSPEHVQINSFLYLFYELFVKNTTWSCTWCSAIRGKSGQWPFLFAKSHHLQ